jgi:peroxiredoxin
MQGSAERELLAEDSEIIGFRGSPQNAEWISTQEVEALLDAKPSENIPTELRSSFVQRVIDGYDAIVEQLNSRAKERGENLLDAHRRVRSAGRWKGVRYSVHPELPPDVLGIYIYLPPTGGVVTNAL